MNYIFKEIVAFIFTIINTIVFNFYYFSFREAIKFPVLVSGNVYFKKLSGKVIVENPKFLGVRIGFGDVSIFDKNISRTIIQFSGTVKFKGEARVGHGSKLIVSGLLELGSGFVITAESVIIVKESVVIGDNVLISWDTVIMDTEFHQIYIDSEKLSKTKPINIESNVWIGTRVMILKGVTIKRGVIVGAMSKVTKGIYEENIIAAGIPCSPIKKGVSWTI